MAAIHFLIETGRASRVAACAGPTSGFEVGVDDLRVVTCDACRAAAPTAWADGFDIWHVRIPASHPHPELLATLMLRDELVARVANLDPRVYEQPLRHAELDTLNPATIVYREGTPS